MADWSQLPTELLQLISQKLNSDFYLLRFRSVCSTWRSSIPNHRPNHHLPPFKLPPLPEDTDNDAICYLVKHNIFLIKPTTIPIQFPIPNQHQQILQPLLIRIGPNVNGNKTHLWHPLDLCTRLPFHLPHKVVFDFNHISIVDLGHVFLLYILKDSYSLQNYPYPYHENVVTATCPGELQPLIVTFNRYYEPCMFRPGDDVWMKIPNVSDYGNICNFKGWTCVVDENGQTVMVGPDLSVDLVAAEISDPGMVRLCAVESELLLVVSNYGGVNVRIDVYRLDEKKKKWVMMSNLGDRVLFLGNQCLFSASASDLGFSYGNCVINMSDVTLKFGMSVLNFHDGRVLPLSYYPDYFKLLANSGVDREQMRWEN